MRRKKNALSQRKPVKGNELGWVSKATRNFRRLREAVTIIGALSKHSQKF